MKIGGRIYRGINFVGQDTHRSPDHQRWNDDAENQDPEFQEADVPARKDIVDEIDRPGNGPPEFDTKRRKLLICLKRLPEFATTAM